MISEDKKVWGVHTQDDYLFLHKDVIAIGWKDFGDLKAIENTREAFKEHYAAVYPQSKKQAIANSAGMLYRFIYEVQAGDYIVFPSKSDRKINIGVVEGEYEYVPSAPEYVQQRKVRWIKHLPRTRTRRYRHRAAMEAAMRGGNPKTRPTSARYGARLDGGTLWH